MTIHQMYLNKIIEHVSKTSKNYKVDGEQTLRMTKIKKYSNNRTHLNLKVIHNNKALMVIKINIYFRNALPIREFSSNKLRIR